MSLLGLPSLAYCIFIFNQCLDFLVPSIFLQWFIHHLIRCYLVPWICVFLQFFLLLISNLTPLWSDNRYPSSSEFVEIRIVSNMWYTLEKVLCISEKNVNSLEFWYSSEDACKVCLICDVMSFNIYICLSGFLCLLFGRRTDWFNGDVRVLSHYYYIWINSCLNI